jgi:hypothetical protein
VPGSISIEIWSASSTALITLRAVPQAISAPGEDPRH